MDYPLDFGVDPTENDLAYWQPFWILRYNEGATYSCYSCS